MGGGGGRGKGGDVFQWIWGSLGRVGGPVLRKFPTGRNSCIRGWGGASVEVENFFFTLVNFFFLPPPCRQLKNANF